MDAIKFVSDEIFAEIEAEGWGYERAIDFIRGKTDYLNTDEKLVLLKEVKNKFSNTFNEHLKVCKDPSDCRINKWNIPFLHIMAGDIRKLENELTKDPGRSDFSAEEPVLDRKSVV